MAEATPLVILPDGTSGLQPSSEQPVECWAKEDPSDTRPWLLFDLNGVLVEESNDLRSSGGRSGGRRWRRNFRARPGIASLLLLRSRYRLGLYSSATMPTVHRALDSISYRLFKELEGYPERLSSLKKDCAAAAAAARVEALTTAAAATATAVAGTSGAYPPGIMLDAKGAAEAAGKGQQGPRNIQDTASAGVEPKLHDPQQPGDGAGASAGGDGTLRGGAPAAAALAPGPSPAPSLAPCTAAPEQGEAEGKQAQPEAQAAAPRPAGMGAGNGLRSGGQRATPGGGGPGPRGARVDARVLFDRVLHRSHCRPDPHWRQRPDGREWDTVKPLAEHGLPLRRCLLVDNEARKSAPGEESNMLTLPTWETAADQGAAAWLALVTELQALPEDPDLDLRLYAAAISSRLAACHVPEGADSGPARPRTASSRGGHGQGQRQEMKQEDQQREGERGESELPTSVEPDYRQQERQQQPGCQKNQRQQPQLRPPANKPRSETQPEQPQATVGAATAAAAAVTVAAGAAPGNWVETEPGAWGSAGRWTGRDMVWQGMDADKRPLWAVCCSLGRFPAGKQPVLKTPAEACGEAVGTGGTHAAAAAMAAMMAVEGRGRALDAGAGAPPAKRARVAVGGGDEPSLVAAEVASKQHQHQQQVGAQNGQAMASVPGSGLSAGSEVEDQAAAVLLRLCAQYAEVRGGPRLPRKAEAALAAAWRERSGSDPRMAVLLAGVVAAAGLVTRGSANHAALLDIVVGRWNRNKQAAECIKMDRKRAARAVDVCLKQGLIRAVPLPGPSFPLAYYIDPEAVAAVRCPKHSFPSGTTGLRRVRRSLLRKQRQLQRGQQRWQEQQAREGELQLHGGGAEDSGSETVDDDDDVEEDMDVAGAGTGPGATPAEGSGAGPDSAQVEERSHRIAQLLDIPPPLLHLVQQGVQGLQACRSIFLSDVWCLVKELVPSVRTAVPQHVANSDLIPRLVRRGVLEVAPTERFIGKRYFVRQLPTPEVFAEALRSVNAREPYDESRLGVAGTVWDRRTPWAAELAAATGTKAAAKSKAGSVSGTEAADRSGAQGPQPIGGCQEDLAPAELPGQRDRGSQRAPLAVAVAVAASVVATAGVSSAAVVPDQVVSRSGGGGGLGSHKRPRPGPDDGPDPSLPSAVPLYGRPWNCCVPSRPPPTTTTTTCAAAKEHGGHSPPPGGGGSGRRPLSALHKEVASFARESSPGEDELAALSRARAAVQRVATELWPTSRVVLFGSQAAGLALPGSDLDLVVLGVMPHLATPAEGFDHPSREAASRLLHKLAKRLRQAGLIREHEVIRAKVPIVKTHLVPVGDDLRPLRTPGRGTGYDMPYRKLAADISIGVANGAAAVALVQRAVAWMPPLRPLCLVLKAMLKEQGLNEVFTGGISSYALVNMVLAHLLCEGYDLRRVLYGGGQQQQQHHNNYQAVQNQTGTTLAGGHAAAVVMGFAGGGCNSPVGGEGGGAGGNTEPPAKRRRRELDWRGTVISTAKKTYFDSDGEGDADVGASRGRGGGAIDDDEDQYGKEGYGVLSDDGDDDDDGDVGSSASSSSESSSDEHESSGKNGHGDEGLMWVASDSDSSETEGSSDDDGNGERDDDLALYIETDVDDYRRETAEAGRSRSRDQDAGPSSPAAWPQPNDGGASYGSSGGDAAFHDAYDMELAAMAEAAAAAAEAAAVLHAGGGRGRGRQACVDGGGGAIDAAAAAGLSEAQLSYLRALSQQDMSGADLGELLVGFLVRFGIHLNPASEAVSILRGGVTRTLPAWSSKHRQQQQRQLLGLGLGFGTGPGGGGPMLAVEDPQQRGKDISAGSFNMSEVLRLFARKARELQRAAGAEGLSRTRNDEEARERALWAAVQSDGSPRSLDVHVEGEAKGSVRHPYNLLRVVLDPELALCRGSASREQQPRNINTPRDGSPGCRGAGGTVKPKRHKKKEKKYRRSSAEFQKVRGKVDGVKRKGSKGSTGRPRAEAGGQPGGQPAEVHQAQGRGQKISRAGNRQDHQKRGTRAKGQGGGEGSDRGGDEGGRGAGGGLGANGGVSKRRKQRGGRGGKNVAARRASSTGGTPGSGKRGGGGGGGGGMQGSRRSMEDGGGSAGKVGAGRGGWVMV